MIVVSDTSPILNLSRIGRLDLLPRLYQRVLVPPAVASELTASAEDLPSAPNLLALPWLSVENVIDISRVRALRTELDAGEAETIVLALERNASLLLVDERRGRRIASTAGLRVMGLLGVVAAAKQAGLIEAAKPVIDDLIHQARFWVAKSLYDEVLAELDER